MVQERMVWWGLYPKVGVREVAPGLDWQPGLCPFPSWHVTWRIDRCLSVHGALYPYAHSWSVWPAAGCRTCWHVRASAKDLAAEDHVSTARLSGRVRG
jgi:hypothetical protein